MTATATSNYLPASRKGIWVLDKKLSSSFLEIVQYDGEEVKVSVATNRRRRRREVWISTKWFICDLHEIGIKCAEGSEQLFIEWIKEEWLRATMRQVTSTCRITTTTRKTRQKATGWACRKRGYHSKAHALKAHRTLGNRFRAYRCELCNKWHISSQKRIERQ